jgi:type IV pilus assembly protein PilW
MNGFNNQRGISLVEILVALVISVFLLAGIVQVYMGNKSTFSFTNALAEVQENGRFALDLMSQDLRLTSEWGCIKFDPDDTDNINNTINAATLGGYDSDFHDFTGEDGIEGTNNTGLNGSDTLTIRGGKTGQANVESPFEPATSADLVIGINSGIGAGDIVLVTRCGANDLLINEEADILLVNSTTSGSPTATQQELTFATGKSQQFENDAMVLELQTVNYFVATGASGEPALFRREFNAAAQELVEGVEDMQILYGVDTDSDDFPNQYQTADAVVDFDDVVAVRVMLLMRSIDDFVTEDPQTYTFNGATVTPGDRRLRQSFSTTIALRNRIGST